MPEIVEMEEIRERLRGMDAVIRAIHDELKLVARLEERIAAQDKRLDRLETAADESAQLLLSLQSAEKRREGAFSIGSLLTKAGWGLLLIFAAHWIGAKP